VRYKEGALFCRFRLTRLEGKMLARTGKTR
jgi:hypothetical protein